LALPSSGDDRPTTHDSRVEGLYPSLLRRLPVEMRLKRIGRASSGIVCIPWLVCKCRPIIDVEVQASRSNNTVRLLLLLLLLLPPTTTAASGQSVCTRESSGEWTAIGWLAASTVDDPEPEIQRAIPRNKQRFVIAK
jgi:hypothetical protein